jgi:hypothetical protein
MSETISDPFNAAESPSRGDDNVAWARIVEFRTGHGLERWSQGGNWGEWCTEAVELWVGCNTCWMTRDGDVLDYFRLLTRESAERYIQRGRIVKYMKSKHRVCKYFGQPYNASVSAAKARNLANSSRLARTSVPFWTKILDAFIPVEIESDDS